VSVRDRGIGLKIHYWGIWLKIHYWGIWLKIHYWGIWLKISVRDIGFIKYDLNSSKLHYGEFG
jgi:hypothetical protein